MKYHLSPFFNVVDQLAAIQQVVDTEAPDFQIHLDFTMEPLGDLNFFSLRVSLSLVIVVVISIIFQEVSGDMREGEGAGRMDSRRIIDHRTLALPNAWWVDTLQIKCATCIAEDHVGMCERLCEQFPCIGVLEDSFAPVAIDKFKELKLRSKKPVVLHHAGMGATLLIHSLWQPQNLASL